MASAIASEPSQQLGATLRRRRRLHLRQLQRRVVPVHLEHEVGADLRARLAPGAAGQQPRVAVAACVDLVVGHRQHARRARVDAEVAALARLDVDHDRAAGAAPSRHGAPPPTPARRSVAGRDVEAGADGGDVRARCAAAGTAGSDAATAASSESSATMPVAATYAPSITIDAVMMLPSSTARSVAGTSTTR